MELELSLTAPKNKNSSRRGNQAKSEIYLNQKTEIQIGNLRCYAPKNNYWA